MDSRKTRKPDAARAKHGQGTRLPYEAPKLSRLGAISNLTAGGGQNKGPDNGHQSN